MSLQGDTANKAPRRLQGTWYIGSEHVYHNIIPSMSLQGDTADKTPRRLQGPWYIGSEHV